MELQRPEEGNSDVKPRRDWTQVVNQLVLENLPSSEISLKDSGRGHLLLGEIKEREEIQQPRRTSLKRYEQAVASKN